MKAFWWFKENKIAGMARPGFNSFRWFDLKFDEAVLMAWLGQYSHSPIALSSWREHLSTYPQRIFRFYNLTTTSGAQELQIFSTSSGFIEVLTRLQKKTLVISEFYLDADYLHFTLSKDRLQFEIDFLKNEGIAKIITLTEDHHHRDILANHFAVHHLAIKDLGVPEKHQATELADLVREGLDKDEKMVVHCLAGIGRTSTMLMAAHLLLGEDFSELETLITKQNPSFSLTSQQGDFVRSIAKP